MTENTARVGVHLRRPTVAASLAFTRRADISGSDDEIVAGRCRWLDAGVNELLVDPRLDPDALDRDDDRILTILAAV